MSEIWQEQLKSALRASAPKLEERFRTLVPQYYLDLIDRSDPSDPIALMALPNDLELLSIDEALRDPIGDQAHLAAPRLTHRYPDRALLHVTNNCTMYCRFCFRKNLMNEREPELYQGDFAPALAYLKANPQIEELILSGGDPWTLSDAKIAELLQNIARELPHLKRLRFHTRVPVTLPARVTPELIAAILPWAAKWQTFVVTHFNHPRELTTEALEALALLRKSGVILLNQAVLLKGVNNKLETLRTLFVGLGNAGVLPYYLHHCDRVAGADHFRTTLAEGQELWRALRGTLPGYLLPEYVMEIPGGGGKIPVGQGFIKNSSVGYELKGPVGQASYLE